MLSTFCLLACQVRLTVSDSELCCESMSRLSSADELPLFVGCSSTQCIGCWVFFYPVHWLLGVPLPSALVVGCSSTQCIGFWVFFYPVHWLVSVPLPSALSVGCSSTHCSLLGVPLPSALVVGCSSTQCIVCWMFLCPVHCLLGVPLPSALSVGCSSAQCIGW